MLVVFDIDGTLAEYEEDQRWRRENGIEEQDPDDKQLRL